LTLENIAMVVLPADMKDSWHHYIDM
jgi:hypothetical protein